MEYGRRRMYFVRNCEERSDKLTFPKHNASAIGFMTGARILHRDKTHNRIIDNVTKVKRTFYINTVIKPFFFKKVQ